jgi:hypothetical protein
VGANVWKSDKVAMRLQCDAQNVSNRLNVIDLGDCSPELRSRPPGVGDSVCTRAFGVSTVNFLDATGAALQRFRSAGERDTQSLRGVILRSERKEFCDRETVQSATDLDCRTLPLRNDDPTLIRKNVQEMQSYALPIFRAGHVPVLGEWLALPLVEFAGSRRIGDDAFNEIFHPIATRLLEKCDAVLRVGGPSTGADEMVRVGQSLGLTIYTALAEIPKVE